MTRQEARIVDSELNQTGCRLITLKIDWVESHLTGEEVASIDYSVDLGMRLSLVLFSTFIFPVYANTDTPGLTVQTQQGPVAGALVVPTVRQFLGVPFASAERWTIPQLPAVRKSVFQATKFGDSCIQELSPGNVEFLNLAGGEGINVTSSEDCMSVNIWAPSVERKQKTSVMIWIYGGGFLFGTVEVIF